MKNTSLLRALALGLFVAGCGTTKNEPYRGTFTFAYEGAAYEITSLVIPANGGHNYLLLREGNRLLLRAKDADQDGTLDTLLVGTVSLENANHIYAQGLAEAQARGKYQVRQSTRYYTSSRPGYTCLVQTYLLSAVDAYNKFILVDTITGDETVSVDLDADGVLDEVERGDGTLEASQKAYAATLQEGIRTGRITRTDNKYTVMPKSRRDHPL
jgi:hypothetical protein